MKDLILEKAFACICGLICSLTLVAQTSEPSKLTISKRLFSVQLSTSNREHRDSVVTFFRQCSEFQKKEIQNHMVQAITDSLRSENKKFAMNYIDYYRLIADSSDDYLPSLVVTEAKMHYDNMNEQGISELITFMKETSAKLSTNLDTEIAELEEMKNEIIQSYKDMQGCWLMYNSNEKFLYPQEIITISKNKQDLFNVSFVDPQIANLQSMGGLGSALLSIWNVPPGGVSDTCYFTKPKQLFYFYSSEKLRRGSETASSILRSGVRSAGNSIIGHLARSENFSTQLFGWFGVIGAEGIFNMLIDELAISRKKMDFARRIFDSER